MYRVMTLHIEDYFGFPPGTTQVVLWASDGDDAIESMSKAAL